MGNCLEQDRVRVLAPTLTIAIAGWCQLDEAPILKGRSCFKNMRGLKDKVRATCLSRAPPAPQLRATPGGPTLDGPREAPPLRGLCRTPACAGGACQWSQLVASGKDRPSLISTAATE